MANDINISPDMINNLVNMLKNNSNTNTDESNNSDSTNDNTSNNSSNENSNAFDFNGSIDFETILKMKSIMETLNTKNDPKSNLLYSLKPYLRKSKQAKLDQYVNLLKISQVTNLFNKNKGDS